MTLEGTPLIVAMTITAGFGWILFGYDNGLLGGLLTSAPFQRVYRLNANLTGTVTGIFEVGCMFGALFISGFGNLLGRRTYTGIGSLLVCIGAIIQASSFSIAQLMVGRIVAGFGLGIITSSVPAWQIETSPVRFRGTIMCASLSFLIVGQMIAYWTDYATVQFNNQTSFRLPFALQSGFALLMTGLIFLMPESPRWLVGRERTEDARRSIGRLRAIDPHSKAVNETIVEIQAAFELEKSHAARWIDLLKPDDDVRSKRRMFTSVAIQVFQSFSGSTVIAYYATPIFENSVGLSPHLAQLMSGYLQIWFLAASFLTWYLIERVGRRMLFMTNAFCQAVVLAVLAAMVQKGTRQSGIIATVMIFLYQSFFTWGWMAGVWVYSSEVISLSWRSKGLGLAVAMQWLFDFVLLQVTPIAIANIGWKTYIMYVIWNLCFIPFVYFFCPETANISLETLNLVFLRDVKNPVKEAVRLARLEKNSDEISTVKRTHFDEDNVENIANDKASVKNGDFEDARS